MLFTTVLVPHASSEVLVHRVNLKRQLNEQGTSAPKVFIVDVGSDRVNAGLSTVEVDEGI